MDKATALLVSEALLKNGRDYDLVITDASLTIRTRAAKHVSPQQTQYKRVPCPLGCGKNVAPTGRGSHYRTCPKRPKSSA